MMNTTPSAGAPQRVDEPAEHPERRNECDQLLHRVLLDAEHTLEFRVSRYCGCLDAVLDPHRADLDREQYELRQSQYGNDRYCFHYFLPCKTFVGFSVSIGALSTV